jgi:hypothetical protein
VKEMKRQGASLRRDEKGTKDAKKKEKYEGRR